MTGYKTDCLKANSSSKHCHSKLRYKYEISKLLNISVACVSIGSIIINFDAIDYIFTRKGSFLRFKDRSTANQKLTEKN